MKKQKICHDDSYPPYDSFCRYCSRSGGCDSEDFRMVEDTEPDSMHIDEINNKKELDKKLSEHSKQTAIAFYIFAVTRAFNLNEKETLTPDEIFELYTQSLNQQ